jgi:hypothetical protein
MLISEPVVLVIKNVVIRLAIQTQYDKNQHFIFTLLKIKEHQLIIMPIVLCYYV